MPESAILETKGLTKHYGRLTAVDDLNLTIYRGEVFGLLGPNGAGKTTTTLMLLGLTEPSAGSARIAGFDCTKNPIAIKRIVGYLPDNMSFYPHLTGRENLRFTGRLSGLDERTIEERIQTLAKRVGLAEAIDRRAGGYSKGMKQRLGIADILMKDPEILIMDEPTTGLDPEGTRELMELVRALSVEEHRTILISSHQLYQVQQVCDRVGTFVKGKLIACGPIGELGRQLEENCPQSAEVMASPAGEELIGLLRGLDGVTEVEKGRDALIVRSERDIRPAIAKAAVDGGFRLEHLRKLGGDLDEIYIRYFEKAGESNGSDDALKRGRKRFGRRGA
ncbi:MAG: ABC transporter ATP-binding protein [Clostridiales bacterium]|nr:ABC transporter ATP-binding protein [Clostridiales bacterium]